MEAYLVPIVYEHVKPRMRLRAFVNNSQQLLPDGYVESVGPDANGEPFVYVRTDSGGLWSVDLGTMQLIVSTHDEPTTQLIAAARGALQWLCRYGPSWKLNGPEQVIQRLKDAIKLADLVPAYGK